MHFRNVMDELFRDSVSARGLHSPVGSHGCVGPGRFLLHAIRQPPVLFVSILPKRAHCACKTHESCRCKLPASKRNPSVLDQPYTYSPFLCLYTAIMVSVLHCNSTGMPTLPTWSPCLCACFDAPSFSSSNLAFNFPISLIIHPS